VIISNSFFILDLKHNTIKTLSNIFKKTRVKIEIFSSVNKMGLIVYI